MSGINQYEQVEQYWDNRPCNIRHSNLTLGTLAHSHEITTRKYQVEPHIPKFAEFGQYKNKNVLEVGCGIGTDTISFAKAGARVLAVDISSRSIGIARARAKAEGVLDRITFIHGNIEFIETVQAIRQQKCYIDLVYSFGVLHHTPNIEDALKNISICTPESTPFKMMVYNRYSIRTLELVMDALPLILLGKFPLSSLDAIVARQSEAQSNCPITHTYTPTMIKSIMNRCLYRDITTTKEHIFPYSVSAYKKHELVKKFPYSMMPQVIFDWLQHHFGWHLCVNATIRG